jgi:hypothetical protein
MISGVSSDLSKCFLRRVPGTQSHHATAQCSIGFQPVSEFATGNTLEIMGVVAQLATTQTPGQIWIMIRVET